MSDEMDAILIAIDALEITRIKGGLWKMTVAAILAKGKTRGVDWTPEQVFAEIEATVKIVQQGQEKLALSPIEGHIQDALAEYRAEARDILT
jgi:hypothetical protein